MLRNVLIWIMLLALPLQGVAGASMLHCVTPVAPAAAHAHPHGDEHMAPPSASIAPAVHLHDHGTGAHAHDWPDEQGAGAVDTATCSACTDCCTVVIALAGLPASLAHPAADVTPRATAPAGHAHLTLGRLERPPRAIV